MVFVTVLLSGVPTYVTLYDLGYYLECLFTSNSEIGAFEIRRLSQENNKPLVALDFRSGFDAIAAQEQLHGYRYVLQDGTEYVLQAKITNKKEYLRGDLIPEWSWRRSKSPSLENEVAVSALAIPTMSDGAMYRAEAKLDAKYKLLQKQKLIVQTEMQLIRERRKLRREYELGNFSDDDQPPSYSRKSRSRSNSREYRSFSQELELYKIGRVAKIQELKATDCYAKKSDSISKLNPSHWKWDIEAKNQPRSLEIESKASSRERSLSKCKSKSRVRSRAIRSRSLSKTSSRERSLSKCKSKSRMRSRAIRSRSLSKTNSRERSLSKCRSKSRMRSRAIRSRSLSKTNSRERSLSKCRSKSRMRSRAIRSRSLSKTSSRERSLSKCKSKSRVRSRAIRSRSLSKTSSRERSLSKCKSKSRMRSRAKRSSSLSKTSSRERSLSKCKSKSRMRSRAKRSSSLSKTSSRERSLSKCKSKSRVPSRAKRSSSLSKTSSRERSLSKCKSKSRVPSRAKRSSSLSKTSSRERSLSKCRSKAKVRSRAIRSRTLSRTSSRERSLRKCRSKSRVICRAVRSRSLSKASSRKRSLSKCKSKSRAVRLGSLSKSPDSSRSQTPSPKIRRSRTRRSSRKRSLSRDTQSRERSRKRIPKKRKRPRRRISRSKTPKTSILREQTNKLEDNKKMGSKSKKTDKKILKVTPKKINSTDKKEDLKNNPMKTKKEIAHIKEMESDETMTRLISDDILFLLESLLLEISIKENIVISDSTAKLMKEKLSVLVQDRVKILYVDKKISVRNAWEIYRKVCTKEEDIVLLKGMLNEIETQKAGTSQTGNQNILEKGANGNDSAENSIRKISNIKLTTLMVKQHDSTEKYQHNKNEGQIVEQTSLEADNGNKTTEVMEVIDLETYRPKESSIKATKKKDKNLPARPQFVLVIKKLMRQLKPKMKKLREKGVFVNYFHMKEVLKIILTDLLKGEGYKTTSEIIAVFRQKYPRANDEEFVKTVAEDINMNKYDLDGVVKESLDDDELMLIETKPEVVTIEDSDDEPGEIREEIIAVKSCLNERTESQQTNEALSILPARDIIVKEAVNSIIEPNDREAKKQPDDRSVEGRESGKTNDTLSCILDIVKSEKINEAYKSNVEVKEIFQTIVRQEPQFGETLTAVSDQHTGHNYTSSSREPKNADITINKEIQQRTETELGHINEDRREEPLKITAITIVTSENELHSIAHGIENKDEDPKGQLKEEIDTELTDADIEKILSLEDIGLDINFSGYNASDAFQQETTQVEDFSSGIDFNGYNTSGPCEKETPQVTAITIMTSASELMAKLDGIENTIKEVPEVKVEINEDVDNETAGQVQVDENIEKNTNVEITCPESQDNRTTDCEEETIESICKYVTSLCKGPRF